MTLPNSIWEAVRLRAHCACEFCGVSEISGGGEFTVDHFRPKSRGGSDEASNLVYACFRCNIYKADYWSTSGQQSPLWHPREEPSSKYFAVGDDGHLHPLNAIGAFSIRQLRLNRPQLVEHRRKRQAEARTEELLERLRSLSFVYNSLLEQTSDRTMTHQELLRELRAVLELLEK